MVCVRHVVAKSAIDDGTSVYRPSVGELWAVYITNPHDRNWAWEYYPTSCLIKLTAQEHLTSRKYHIHVKERSCRSIFLLFMGASGGRSDPHTHHIRTQAALVDCFTTTVGVLRRRLDMRTSFELFYRGHAKDSYLYVLREMANYILNKYTNGCEVEDEIEHYTVSYLG